MNSIWKLRKVTVRFVPLFAEVVALKVQFWQRLKRGFNEMNEFYEFTQEFMSAYQEVRRRFETEFSRETSASDKGCVYYPKLQAIFQAVILNDLLKTYKLEV